MKKRKQNFGLRLKYKGAIAYILPAVFALCSLSCKEFRHPEAAEIQIPDEGAFIVCEGNYSLNNGSISFFSLEEGKTTNYLYEKSNGAPLGDVVQSLCVAGRTVYISVNNSKRLAAVNLKNMKLSKELTGLSYPRQIIAGSDGMLYLSNAQFPGELLKIDSEELSIKDRLKAGASPENLLEKDGKIWLCNGAWGNDSTLSLIDTETFTLDTLLVLNDGTTDLCVSGEKEIAVLCSGKNPYGEDGEETRASIVFIDTDKLKISQIIKIGNPDDGFLPSRIASAPDGSIYYAEKDGVRKINRNEGTSELLVPGDFYGLDVNPKNGNIYCLSAENFTGQGILYVYSSEAELIGEFSTGIGPNSAIFF